MELTAQGSDSTFTFHHALFKKDILLLQKGKGAETFLCLCMDDFSLGGTHEVGTF